MVREAEADAQLSLEAAGLAADKQFVRFVVDCPELWAGGGQPHAVARGLDQFGVERGVLVGRQILDHPLNLPDQIGWTTHYELSRSEAW